MLSFVVVVVVFSFVVLGLCLYDWLVGPFGFGGGFGVTFCLVFGFFQGRTSYVASAGLELKISSCLSLRSVMAKGVHHHTQSHKVF